jgi:hypothetical protein
MTKHVWLIQRRPCVLLVQVGNNIGVNEDYTHTLIPIRHLTETISATLLSDVGIDIVGTFIFWPEVSREVGQFGDRRSPPDGCGQYWSTQARGKRTLSAKWIPRLEYLRKRLNNLQLFARR